MLPFDHVHNMEGCKSKEVTTAKEAMDVLSDISKLLNTGLDSDSLAVCARLCEKGVNPEALALVIKELRRETAQVTESDESTSKS